MPVEPTLRVLSYNVRSMRDDVGALASVVRACRPDVLCAQELPRLWRWRAACARLARLTGLVYVAGGATTTGPGLFVAPAVTVSSVVEAKLSPDPHRHQRGVAVARCALGGAPFTVASIHLGLDGDQRRRHAGEVLTTIGPVDGALVVAGDLNEGPGSPAWDVFTAAGLRDAYAVSPWGEELTFSSSNPRHRIDAVFVSADVEVRLCGVPADLPGLVAATDHRPLLAELGVTSALG